MESDNIIDNNNTLVAPDTNLVSKPAEITIIAQEQSTHIDLTKYFHLPIQNVAKDFGICITIFKKICRQNNITKWPYRQLKSLNNAIQGLEMTLLSNTMNEHEKHKINCQIHNFKEIIDKIFSTPSLIGMLILTIMLRYITYDSYAVYIHACIQNEISFLRRQKLQRKLLETVIAIVIQIILFLLFHHSVAHPHHHPHQQQVIRITIYLKLVLLVQ